MRVSDVTYFYGVVELSFGVVVCISRKHVRELAVAERLLVVVAESAVTDFNNALFYIIGKVGPCSFSNRFEERSHLEYWNGRRLDILYIMLFKSFVLIC